MSKYRVYFDANVLLDFSIDKQLFTAFDKFLEINASNSIYCTSSIIHEKEINKSQFVNQMLQYIKIEDIDALKFMQFINNKPELDKLDEGEISLYFLAIESKQSSCIITNDKTARKFFEKEKLLPCTHMNPHVGGTLGILNHLKHHGYITENDRHSLEEILRQANRRI